LVVALGILAGGAWAYARNRDARPCVRPIPYALGSIDSRFQLGGDALIRDASVAAAIWNQAAGRTLFALRPSADLKINLVYDTRQQTTTLGVALDQEDAEHQAERKALDALQYRVMSEGAAYNDEVRVLTTRGGATPDELHALDEKRVAIETLSDSLKRFVARFNQQNAAIKSKVDEFNRAAGQTFAAGHFVRDARGERIDVFRFIGDTELTRLLAHEFGHALGLDHNEDSTSIMYALDESGNLVPSAADMTSLQNLCGIKH
jgi:hypothetical protein